MCICTLIQTVLAVRHDYCLGALGPIGRHDYCLGALGPIGNCCILYISVCFLIPRPVRMHMDIDTNMQMVGKRFPFYAQFKVILIVLLFCVWVFMHACDARVCTHACVCACDACVHACMKVCACDVRVMRM